MIEKIKKWGSIGILSTIGGTLVAAITIWLFGQAVNIKPMADAIDRLTVATENSNKINTIEHSAIFNRLYDQGGRLNVAETRLDRVIVDCNSNGIEIKECIKDMK